MRESLDIHNALIYSKMQAKAPKNELTKARWICTLDTACVECLHNARARNSRRNQLLFFSFSFLGNERPTLSKNIARSAEDAWKAHQSVRCAPGWLYSCRQRHMLYRQLIAFCASQWAHSIYVLLYMMKGKAYLVQDTHFTKTRICFLRRIFDKNRLVFWVCK